MSGKAIQMITGANAILKVDEVTIAYAMNVSYDIQVQTIPIEPMGNYEVLAYEPIATYVSGSLTIIRYHGLGTAKTQAVAPTNDVEKEPIKSFIDRGNGLGNFGTVNSQGNQAFLNPAEIIASKTIDIEVFRKQVKSDGTVSSERVIKIRDARLEQVSATLNKNSVLMETYTFVAEMMDGDSYTSTDEVVNDLVP
jgi:hypothetical protein